MHTDKTIIVENVHKYYPGDVQALNGISFQVEPGERFGLIGPDGAGKTSLMRILTTLLLADEGRAEVAGWDVVRDYRQIRRHVGYMPGRFSLYEDLTVEENLHFYATIFGSTIAENYDLIEDIYKQIEPFKTRRAGNLSGGMKQKLALSCALIHRPHVLFLDEPTTGVDAVSRREFWDMLQQLQNKGITILVSTPYMDEAGRCDRVALIQEGRVLSIDSPASIVSAYERPLLAVRSHSMYQLIEDLRAFEYTHTAYPFGEYVHLALTAPLWPEVVQAYLSGKEHADVEVKPIQATIEDCFMELMGTESNANYPKKTEK